MRIKTILNITLLAVLVSMCVQACSGTGTSSTASSTSRTAFSSEISIEVDELEIKPEMSSNTLSIKKMSLDSGRLVFKLSSPDGRIQWEEAFAAPLRCPFPPFRGLSAGMISLVVSFQTN